MRSRRSPGRPVGVELLFPHVARRDDEQPGCGRVGLTVKIQGRDRGCRLLQSGASPACQRRSGRERAFKQWNRRSSRSARCSAKAGAAKTTGGPEGLRWTREHTRCPDRGGL